MTLTDFLLENTDSNKTFSGFQYKKVLVDGSRNILINYSDILDKYDTILKDYLVPIRLTEKERFEYKYNPKKLALKLYGSTEYWYLIIKANQMHSIAEFDRRNIMIYRKTVLDVLNTIMSSDKCFIDENAEEIVRALAQ